MPPPVQALQGAPQPSEQTHRGNGWSPEEPCRLFMRYGVCKFGPQCKFSHVARLPVLNPRPAVDQAQALRSRGVCHQYVASGKCLFGERCRFNHPLPPPPGHAGAPGIRGGGGVTALPCFQFRDIGQCKFGPSCKFSHDVSKVQAPHGATQGSQCPWFSATGYCQRGDSCWFRDSHRPVKAV